MTRKSWYMSEANRLRDRNVALDGEIQKLKADHRVELDGFAGDVLAVLGAAEQYPDVQSTTRVREYVYNRPGVPPADAIVQSRMSHGYGATESWSGMEWVDKPITIPGVVKFIADIREAAQGARGSDALARLRTAIKSVK